MKEYMLTLVGAHTEWNRKTEADWKVLMQQHDDWMRKVGKYKAGEKLAAAPSRTLSGDRNNPKITDGPFSETKEVITGFYIVEARDMEHATELAKGCPWLLHNRLEIFEVES